MVTIINIYSFSFFCSFLSVVFLPPPGTPGALATRTLYHKKASKKHRGAKCPFRMDTSRAPFAILKTCKKTMIPKPNSRPFRLRRR